MLILQLRKSYALHYIFSKINWVLNEIVMKISLPRSFILLILLFPLSCFLFAVAPKHLSVSSDSVFKEEQRFGISEINNDSRMIAFCFNNVASSTYFTELLGLLDKNNVKATFFIDGTKADRNAAVLNRLAEGGHELASSGMGDDFLTTLEDEEIRNRIAEAEQKIKAVSGKKPLCFMAPERKYNQQVIGILDQMKIPAISPAILVDYKPAPSCGDIDIYQQYIVQQINSGSIIHVSDEYYNLILLRHMLKYLTERQYKIVSISEMAKDASDPELQSLFQ